MPGLLDDMKAAQTAKARGAMSHRKFDPVTGRQFADAMQSASLLASPVPVLGDVAGLLGDAAMYAAKPEERTMGNAALTALGVLPFFPALAGSLGRAGRVLDVTDADTFKAVKAAMGGDKIPEGEIRQAVAQYNATLSKNVGGLELGPSNSAASRSGALGFSDQKLYHGGTNDFPAFSVSDRSNVYATDEPRIADIYANATGRHRALREINAAPNVMPLVSRGPQLTVSDVKDGNHGWSQDNLAAALGIEPKRGLYKEAGQRGYGSVKVENMTDLGGAQSQWVFPDPAVLRSRFAAFDPAQSSSRNLLASLAGVGLLSPAILASMRDERQ